MNRARDRILATVERIFRREGLAGVSIRRIARTIGVTPMALYRHYRDKAALVDALTAAGFGRWEERLAAAVKSGSPRQRVVNAVRAYRDFALDERRHFELMFLTARSGIPRAPHSLGSTSSPAFGRAIAAVKECMRAGDFPSGEPGDFILLVWAMAHGLIALHFSGRFENDDRAFRRIYDRAVSTFLGHLQRPLRAGSRTGR